MPTPLLPSLALGFPLLVPPPAQEPEAAAEPKIELEGLDGSVRQLSAEGFTTGDPRELGAVFVRFQGLPQPDPLSGEASDEATIGFQNGDRLTGHVQGGEGDDLTLRIHGDALLRLSIDEIQSVVFRRRLPRDGGEEPVPAEDGDRLYRLGGSGLDKIDGLVDRFTADGLVFKSRLGKRAYPWGRLAALFVEDLEEAVPESVERPDVPVVVALRGGGRLSGGLVRLEAAGCRLTVGADRELSLPARVVAEVAVDDGSYRFLSQIPVTDAGPLSPWGGADDLGMVYPHRADRAFNDRPLRAGGRHWARGIGVHAPSRLTWTLDGGWKELRGRVAIDDQVLDQGNRHGSVVFRVWVDGELRYESATIRGGGAPRPIDTVELRGARELVLEVDAVGDHVMDRADWLRPILVRG